MDAIDMGTDYQGLQSLGPEGNGKASLAALSMDVDSIFRLFPP